MNMTNEKKIDEKTLVPLGTAAKIAAGAVAAVLAVLPVARWMGRIDERTAPIPQLVSDVAAMKAVIAPVESKASAKTEGVGNVN